MLATCQLNKVPYTHSDEASVLQLTTAPLFLLITYLSALRSSFTIDSTRNSLHKAKNKAALWSQTFTCKYRTLLAGYRAAESCNFTRSCATSSYNEICFISRFNMKADKWVEIRWTYEWPVNVLWLVQTHQCYTKEQESESQMLSIIKALIMVSRAWVLCECVMLCFEQNLISQKLIDSSVCHTEWTEIKPCYAWVLL